MPTPPSILNKVKLLLKLSESPNPYESQSARKLAQDLIDKHAITSEELESLKDHKPLYGDNELVFSTLGITGWKQQLVLCIGKHFECQIVQEEMVPTEGEHTFHYYAYGEPDQVDNVKFAFPALAHQVEELVETNCSSKGDVYVSSYCEGIVAAIRENILMYGIRLPDKKRMIQVVKADSTALIRTDAIESPQQKPQPAERHVDVNDQSKIEDIIAYFAGLGDGRELYLDAVLAAAEVKELSNEN